MTEAETIRSEVAELAHKHVHVSYAILAVMVLVLGLVATGGYVGLKLFDAQLARAEKAEVAYNQDRKDLTALLAANQAQRQADTKAQQVIVQVVHDRAAATAAVEAQVMAPKTAPQAVTDLNQAYKGRIQFDPTLTIEGKLAFPVGQVQIFSTTELERERLSLDLGDSQSLLALEQSKTASLSTDLGASQTTLKECQDVLVKYKHAAKLSKFKKFLHGAGIVAIAIGAAYAGHKL